MSMRGLNWQPLHLPFAVGLNQKADPRAMQPPALARFVDGQFDEIGGIQTRYPFALMSTDIFGGGTIADPRRIVENGNELLLFTKSALYSWNAQLSKWVLKGTHLAVKVSETSHLATTADQVDRDRAELSGTIVYCWTEIVGATSTGHVAAIDKTTGNVLLAPYQLAGSAARLRLTTLSTKILLSFYDGVNGIYAYALDPASPATALAGASTTLTNSSFGTYYDITRVLGADQAVFVCRQNPTTSYTVGTVTGGLVVATASKARTCDGPIAVSSAPGGTQVQIVRSLTAGATGEIKGDLLDVSGLADVYTDQAIGTTTATASGINQIAAAHRSTQDSGTYRCYVFWTANEADDVSDWQSKSNWVSTTNTLGTEATFVRRLGLASRAFDHEGRIYVWGVFAGASGSGYRSFRAQLQNSYFLYRDDGFLVAKAAFQRAAGFSYSTSYLPGVALTDTGTYSWCGGERRVISLGANSTGYEARAPRDVSFTFDTNEARRTARLGRTLYISGGELLQYDGRQIVEVGFHVYPWNFDMVGVGAGNIEIGTYAYKQTWKWENAAGEVDRSTTATTVSEAVAGSSSKLSTTGVPLHTTHKTTPAIAVEFWRTLKNPSDDAPFYLATSKDPASASNPNRYLFNKPTSDYLDQFDDNFSDDTIDDKESSGENGGLLENLSPPAATIVVANDTRLFLAGVAGDQERVWYSKQRNDGEVASFHDALVAPIPTAGGVITALAFVQETLVVFRETAVYVLPGDGFDNAGAGVNYGPARCLSTDIGAVNHESVASTDKGLLFKSSKGWYLLTKGWALEYVGAAIADYDSETPLAIQVVESQHQVRILTASRMLFLDTLVGQWGEWSISDGIHACMWNGTHVYLTSSAAKQQQSTYTNLTYGLDVETGWIKLADLQGFGRVRRFEILGEYRSTHTLRIRVARDYWKDGVDTYFDDKVWTVSPTTAGGPLQVKHGPSIQQMQAIKIRITATTNVEGSYASANPADAESDTYSIQDMARTIGTVANGWTLQLVADGVGAGSFTDGTAAVFHYQSGVTTMDDLVVASALSSYHLIGGSGTINRAQTLTLTGGINAVSGTPAGEALKLTGLGLELGFKHGLHRQLPAAQKQ